MTDQDAKQPIVWTAVNERRNIVRDYIWDLLKDGELELSGQYISEISEYVKHFGADGDLYQEERMGEPITVKEMRDQARARKNLDNWLSGFDVLNAKGEAYPMPTTNSPKPAIIPVRLTPAQAAQVAELTAAGWGNQSDVIRTAIDRMHQQEFGKGDNMSKVSVKQANDVDHENAYYVTLNENGLTEKLVAWTGKDGKGLWIDYGAGAKQVEGRAQFEAGTNAAAAMRRYFTRKP